MLLKVCYSILFAGSYSPEIFLDIFRYIYVFPEILLQLSYILLPYILDQLQACGCISVKWSALVFSNYESSEATTGFVISKKVFLKNFQNSRTPLWNFQEPLFSQKTSVWLLLNLFGAAETRDFVNAPVSSMQKIEKGKQSLEAWNKS